MRVATAMMVYRMMTKEKEVSASADDAVLDTVANVITIILVVLTVVLADIL